jgi:hypothetical protein
MTDETKQPAVQSAVQPAPATQIVEVAEGPNATVHADMVKTAHAAPDGAVQFIVHEDGSKSVRYADTPQRREED